MAEIKWSQSVFHYNADSVAAIAKLLPVNEYDEIKVFEMVWVTYFQNEERGNAGSVMRLIRKVKAVLELHWNCPEKAWGWLCESQSWMTFEVVKRPSV